MTISAAIRAILVAVLGKPKVLCLRLLQLPRSADQRTGTGGVPASCHRPLAAHAAATQPKGSDDMGTDDAADGCLGPTADHPSSVAERSLCRHTPEVGAVCGKAARTVLCGGRAMKRAFLPLLANCSGASSSRLSVARRQRGRSRRARSSRRCRWSDSSMPDRLTG
jgi:hypothetical protein